MSEDLTTYPQPQQYYKINMTALTWGELYRASGNPISFVLSLPILGAMKLFRAQMTATVMPQEITFRPPSHALPLETAARLQGLVEGMQVHGFAPFTTFEVPEMPYRNMIFALVHDSGTAYADVTYMPVRNLHYFEIISRFADGTALTTINRRGSTNIQPPPGKISNPVVTQDTGVLWQSHQARVAELEVAHGAVRSDLTQETFFPHFREAIRTYALFQASRGVFVPTPPPLTAPGSWQK